MRARWIPIELLVVFFVLLSSGCSPSFELGYSPPYVPIRVSVDSRGDVALGLAGSYTTSIGTFDVSGGHTILSIRTAEQYRQRRLLIVRVDGEATVYELVEGEEFRVTFEGDNTLYRRVALQYESDGDIVLELESVGNTSSGGQTGNPVVFRPVLQDVQNMRNLWNLAGYQDMSQPGTRTYYVNVRSADTWRWGFSWHAVDSAALQEILRPFSVQFLINGQRVSDADVFTYSDTDSNGWVCKRWVMGLSSWPANRQVELEVRYTLSESIYDGKDYFSPGTYRQVIVVAVN